MSDILRHLNAVNGIEIKSVYDDAFKTYGKVIDFIDVSDMIEVMRHTEIPEEGNVYVPSYELLEECHSFQMIRKHIYGGMPIQAGYCNGKNTTVNGFEYHKGSEINIAVDGFMLNLGHVWDMDQYHYEINKAEVFYVPEGTVIEMYQTTLHLSPCRIKDEGFRCPVILPLGTNMDFEGEIHCHENAEDQILLKQNKWVAAHPERIQLTSQGAKPWAIGVNRELKY